MIKKTKLHLGKQVEFKPHIEATETVKQQCGAGLE